MGLKEELDRQEQLKAQSEDAIHLIREEMEHREDFKKKLSEVVKGIGETHTGFSPDDPSI